MKTLIGVVSAIIVVIVGVVAAFRAHSDGAREVKTPAGIADSVGEPAPIPIPETLITLKHDLQWKDGAGNAVLVLKAGEQLATESTQGLDYLVSREGRSFRIRCDDAGESHGRFANGQAEQLALQLAAEIRAENKVPTKERIVSRAQEALEQRRLNASFPDPASVVDNLQRVLLLQPGDLDTEAPPQVTGKPD